MIIILGLHIDSTRKLGFKDNDVAVDNDLSLLLSEVNTFINIRSGNENENGELFYDQNIGLDHRILFEGDENQIEDHISTQIFKFFSDRITEIYNFVFDKDYKYRSLGVSFIFKSIYDKYVKIVLDDSNPSDWILYTGNWNDDGLWIDEAVWNDGI